MNATMELSKVRQGRLRDNNKDANFSEKLASLLLFATTTSPAATRLLTPALVPVPHPTGRSVALAKYEPKVDEAPHLSPPSFELAFDAGGHSPDLAFFSSPASLPVA